MSTDREPLTPEERALAQRLARLGGSQAEPSPSLDARILAAAHAAAGTDDPRAACAGSRRARKPARWPAVFGVAASLALACGIAWQLRPVPAPPAQADAAVQGEEPLAEFRAPPSRPPMAAQSIPRRPLNVPEAPPAEPAPQRRQRSASIRPATPADADKKPQAFDRPADDWVTREAMPAPAPAAAPAAPPPPAAAVAAEEVGAAAAMQAAPAPARDAAAAKSAAGNTQRMERAASAETDESDVPPATADSPEVRDAWLQRIRELVHEGKVDEARESLGAFRKRYPRADVPEDLRAIDE